MRQWQVHNTTNVVLFSHAVLLYFRTWISPFLDDMPAVGSIRINDSDVIPTKSTLVYLLKPPQIRENWGKGEINWRWRSETECHPMNKTSTSSRSYSQKPSINWYSMLQSSSLFFKKILSKLTYSFTDLGVLVLVCLFSSSMILVCVDRRNHCYLT